LETGLSDVSKSVAHKTGLPPGSLVHVAHHTNTPTQVTEINYSSNHFQQQVLSDLSNQQVPHENDIQWLIVEGLSNVEVIRDIGQHFGLHELVLEDILNTHQRPKFEDHDDYIYIVMKMFKTQQQRFTVPTEQISLIIFKQRVIIFREYADDLLKPIQQRLQAKNSKMRCFGSDYLAYILVDTIVDRYFDLRAPLKSPSISARELATCKTRQTLKGMTSPFQSV